jgi:hypothetical protein
MVELEHIQEMSDAIPANYQSLASAEIAPTEQRPRLSLEETINIVEDLNPEASARDKFLPQQEYAISQSDHLIITVELLPFVLKKLPVGSAAGAIGMDV